MELDFALLARSAVAAEGEFNALGGGLSSVLLPTLPAVISIAVVTRFVAQPEEFGESYAFGLQVYEPLMLRPSAAPMGTPFKIESSSEDPDDPLSVIAVMSLAGLRLEREGVYRFDLLVDGKVVKEMPLKVRRGRREQPLPHRQFSGEFEQESPAAASGTATGDPS